MRNSLSLCVRVVVGLLLTVVGVAHAQFVSLHRLLPVTYTISSALDPQGNIYFTKTPELFGFKDQFAPYGVSGCVIGYPELRQSCQTVNGGFGFIIDNFSEYPQFRVYIPAGTTFFGLSGFMPQGTEFAVAVKMDSPPDRMRALTELEYEDAKRDQKVDLDFNFLLTTGREKIMVHDGGGIVSLSGTARLGNNPLPEGHWFYFRVLNGNYINSLRASYEVDLPKYRAWYDSAVATGRFEADGDPKEGAGPIVPPSLQGITLSASSWTVGTGGAPTLTLSASPAGAVLPGNCTVSPAGVLTVGVASGSSAAVTVNMAAAQALGRERNDFVVDCAGKTANFTIIKSSTPPPVVATATVREVQQTPEAPAVLLLDVTHPATEVGPNAKVSYYVGGLVPAHQFSMAGYDDVVFFLANRGAPNVTPALREWALLFKNQPLESVAFERDRSLTSASQAVQIPLIFKRDDFKSLGARMRFGYTLQDGQFKVLDVIWDPAR